MTLFPVNVPIRLKRKPITAKNVQALLPCTFERAHQVFIGDRLNVESKEYKRLRQRLEQVWDGIVEKKVFHGN